MTTPRPISIYWLYDTLSQIPFYCGKSVRPRGRLKEHITNSSKRARLPIDFAVLRCGENIELRIVEVATPNTWVDREKHWIKTLRAQNPQCVNISEGGAGAAGSKRTAAQKAAISARVRQRCADPDYIAKLSASHKGQKLSPEHREKAAAHLRKMTGSAEYRAGVSARTKLRWQDPEYRAKMIVMATGKTIDAKAREKIAASKRGKPLSDAHRAKVGAAHRGKIISQEQRAIISATHKGKPIPAEQRAKMSASAKAWRAARREAAQNA